MALGVICSGYLLPVSLVNRLIRQQDITNQTITLRDQPSFWGGFNGTTLIFSVCQFKAIIGSYLVSFQQNSSVATLTVLPLNGWELVICFYLEQLSPVLKVARLLWNTPRVHFLWCYVSKQTPSHEAQSDFKDKCQVLTTKINSQHKPTDW